MPFLHYVPPRPLAGFVDLFGNRFREEVGLTPKLYCRVQRFQDALRRIHGQRQVDLADLAYACGYFDQAHFNHDFRDFSGLSPSEYLASASLISTTCRSRSQIFTRRGDLAALSCTA